VRQGLPRRAAVLAPLLALLAPGATAAQIVNVQPLLRRGDTAAWSGALAGSLDWRTGNTDALRLGATGSAQHRQDGWRIMAIARVELERDGGATVLDRDFEHLRWRWDGAGRVQPEAFLQHDRDAFRRLQLRGLAGAGARVVLGRWDGGEVAVAAAPMLEREVISLAGGGTEGALVGRLSTSVFAHHAVDDHTRAALTAYLQPRLDDPGDLRLLAEAELAVGFAERLSVRLAFTAAADSRPPPEVERLDTTFRTAFALEL
jgi:hypothetical protein